MQEIRQISLCLDSPTQSVYVAAHLGEDLFSFLASRGIETTLVRKMGSLLMVLELDEGANLNEVYGLLNQWGFPTVKAIAC
jgi:hypothetical protein